MAASVTKLYLNVIKDVIEKVKKELEGDGKEDDSEALKELQELWEKKMFDSGAVPPLTAMPSLPSIPHPFQSYRPAAAAKQAAVAAAKAKEEEAADDKEAGKEGEQEASRAIPKKGGLGDLNEPVGAAAIEAGEAEEEGDELSLARPSADSANAPYGLDGRPQQYMPKPGLPGQAGASGAPSLPDLKQPQSNNAFGLGVDMNAAPPEDEHLAATQSGAGAVAGLLQGYTMGQQHPAGVPGLGLSNPGTPPGMMMGVGVGVPVGMSMGVGLPMGMHQTHPYYSAQGGPQGMPQGMPQGVPGQTQAMPGFLQHAAAQQQQQAQAQAQAQDGRKRTREEGADPWAAQRRAPQWPQGQNGYIPQTDGSHDAPDECESADEAGPQSPAEAWAALVRSRRALCGARGSFQEEGSSRREHGSQSRLGRGLVPQVDGEEDEEEEGDEEDEEEEGGGGHGGLDDEEEEDYNAPPSPLQGDDPGPETAGAGGKSTSAAQAKEFKEGDRDDETLGEDDDDDDDDEESRAMMAQDEGEPGTRPQKANHDMVLALFEKVTRAKNRWKCVLTSGVMNFNGKDYVFNKANGEFEF